MAQDVRNTLSIRELSCDCVRNAMRSGHVRTESVRDRQQPHTREKLIPPLELRGTGNLTPLDSGDRKDDKEAQQTC